MLFNTFSRNGKILPTSDANISLENLEYTYGFGVYETMKIRRGILYFSSQHIDRLLNSAKIINLEHLWKYSQIDQYLQTLTTYLNNFEPNLSGNLKILLIGANNPADAQLFILPLNPFYPDRSLYKNGAFVGTVEYERWKPQAKTLNMLPSYIYYTQGKKNGWYDTLLVNKQQEITEGTRTNFFAIKNKTIFTPPSTQILQGVTHQTVLYTAKNNGYKIVEQPIPVNSIQDYDGAFLTSTSSKIIPIKQIDDYQFKEKSSEIQYLIELYNDFLDMSEGIFTAY